MHVVVLAAARLKKKKVNLVGNKNTMFNKHWF